MAADLVATIVAGAGGLLFGIFGHFFQESVKGYLALRNARRHVLDMLVTETTNAPCISQSGVPGAYVVTAMRRSVSRATREALKAYLEAARRSPFRRSGDRRAVEALATRLQYETAEVGRIDFLAICGVINSKRTRRAVEHYSDLTRKRVEEVAESVDPGRAAAMGAEESAALFDKIARVQQALPGRPRSQAKTTATFTPSPVVAVRPPDRNSGPIL